MGEATGFPVMRLARVAFAGISGEGLAPGRFRHLTRDELVALKKTYGVPRSIPSAGAIAARSPRPLRGPAPVRGTAARASRAFGSESRRESPGPRRDGAAAERPRHEIKEDWGAGNDRGKPRRG